MAKAAKKSKDIAVEEIDVGDALISWETWDIPPYQRGIWWYIIAGVICLALIIYGFFSQNYIFSVIILMIAVIYLMNNLRQSKRIPVHITTLGIVLGTDFFPYKEIKDFSIVYQPPEVQLLYVDFQQLSRPLVSIDFSEVNPNTIREALLPYAFENLNREEETLTDTLRRVYKI